MKKQAQIFLKRILSVTETCIAFMTLIILILMLTVFIADLFRNPQQLFLEGATTLLLQKILTIVVGLEFVKLLIHMSPVNILEVLIMAISRHIVVGHGSSIDCLLSILCIIALFAAKRFLIPSEELNLELEESESGIHYEK